MQQRVMCLCAAALAAAVVNLPALAQQTGAAAPQGSPSSAAANPVKGIREGDAAPSLEGITWLKGEPVTKFESGKFYIVEIWATWCGPCKRGIPHLTELQAKHKDKLTVIGISCWERRDDAAARVEAARSFVEQQGPAMDYTVAADGDGVIVRNWMEAAARRSIPTAFIVDGFGNIAWIGNPSQGVDAVLEKVLAGGFDARAEAAKAKAAAAVKAIKDEKFARANLLGQQGNYAEGVKLIDEVLATEESPAARVPIIRQKFRMMLKADEAGAYEYAGSLLNGEFKDNDFALYTLADSILKAEDVKVPNYNLAVALMTRAQELADPANAAVHEAMALARYRAGDVEGAIAAAEHAIEVMKMPGTKASMAGVNRVQKQLEEYRAALASKK